MFCTVKSTGDVLILAANRWEWGVSARQWALLCMLCMCHSSAFLCLRDPPPLTVDCIMFSAIKNNLCLLKLDGICMKMFIFSVGRGATQK